MSAKNKVLSTLLNFLKGYKRMSVRWALVFFVLLGTILPFVIFSTFMFAYLHNFMYNILMDSANQSVKNNSTQLESIVQSLNYTSAFLSTSPYVIEQIIIMDNKDNTAQAITARDNLIKYVKDISNATLNTTNPKITIITKNGKVIELEKVYNLGIEFNKLVADNFNENRIVWNDLLNPGLSTSLKTSWIIRGTNGEDDAVGLIIIEIPGDILWNKLANRSSLSSTRMYINDSHNCTICVSSLSEYNSDFKNYATVSKDNMVISFPIGNWGLKLVAITPLNIITNQLTKLSYFILPCFIALIVILLFVLDLISKYISQPIVLLNEYVHNVQLGKFREKPGSVYFKDMDVLSENLVEVSEYIGQLMETTVNQAIAKEKMRFDTLRAQINPHFLYNTLNSIKWMATINGDHSTAAMITDLGKILNNALGKHGETTTLKDELDVLNSYIALQKMRYGETFVYKVNVDNELMDCLVPRFTLQPLVENAIVHGVFSKSDGLISISAQREDDILIISVTDNGSGMDNNKAQKLLKSSPDADYSTGLGITNVHDRIQILYGNRYGLKIKSEVGKGFTVSMLIPYDSGSGKQPDDITS